MSKYKTSKITNSGQQLLLNCLANKAELQFTRIAFGSGEYASDSGIVAQTALKSEKQSVSISTISVKSSNSVVVSSILSNKELEKGYRITEIGLFAKNKLDTSAQEILYAICIAEDGYADYFPEYNGYAPTKILQDFYIEVADSSSTTILVDDSVGVSKAYLEENYYNSEQIDNFLNEKYNSSNVEAGRGTLTNVSTSGASIKSANYVYQRVGNFVNVNITIDLNESSGEIKLSGLPVRTSEYSSGVCVSYEGTLCVWSIDSKSMTDSTAILSINKVGTGEWTHRNGEAFSFMATYEVF